LAHFPGPAEGELGSHGVIEISKDNRVSIQDSAGTNAPGRLAVRACLNGR
jgi:hypothetical protein